VQGITSQISIKACLTPNGIPGAKISTSRPGIENDA